MKMNLCFVTVLLISLVLAACAYAQHGVIPGSSGNTLNLNITNLSDLLYVKGAETEVARWSGIIADVQPESVALDPPDLAPWEGGSASYTFDVAPEAEIGEFGYMHFLLTSATGDSTYLEVEVIAIVPAGLEAGETPQPVAIFQNFPNPFQPLTSVRFSLPREEQVALRVYDVSGKLVRTLVNSKLSPGQHTFVWDGKNYREADVAPGVYFCILKSESLKETRKIVRLR